jgi:flagellar FliL protein
MAKKNTPNDAAATGVKAPAKGKRILLIVLVLLLGMGASVSATWFFLTHDAEQKDLAVESAETPPTKKPAIYEELQPAFVVNFMHDGRPRYMQVSVALLTRDQVQLDALKVHMPVLRNNLVMLFSAQDFSSLLAPDGKEKLRQQATASVQQLAQKETGNSVIEQVLFTNFVLQ